MKKVTSLILIFAFFLLVKTAYGQPAPTDTGTPLVYKVTLKKLRISQDGGTNWTTVREEDVEFDIASINVGAVVGNFFSGTLTPGTYDTIEHTSSASFRMQGYLIDAVGGTDYYTSTTAGNGTNSTANFDANNPPSDYGEAKITVYDETEDAAMTPETSTVSIPIEEGVSKRVRISFDVTNTLALYTNQLMPGPPTVTISVE